MKSFFYFITIFVLLVNTSCKSKDNNSEPVKKKIHSKINAGSLWDCEEYIDTSNNKNNPYITSEDDSIK